VEMSSNNVGGNLWKCGAQHGKSWTAENKRAASRRLFIGSGQNRS
jgi:hypothetical protein